MTCPDRATRSERIWSGLPCSRRGVPYLLRSPERSSYSNGPKTTRGAGFSWLPIAGVRLHHNPIRLNQFRVEVKFKAKCIGLMSPGSVTVHPREPERTRKSCKERNNANTTVYKGKDKYEDHPENQHLSAH